MTKAKPKKTPAKKANGKTTSKTAKVLALRRRPTGCTRERLTATEWPSISMQAVAKAAGVKLRVDKKERALPLPCGLVMQCLVKGCANHDATDKVGE
jgi:hypothetical protein